MVIKLPKVTTAVEEHRPNRIFQQLLRC